ncbi:MAG: alkaline phosphatase [Bradymonadaceae bacterium]
MTDRFPALDLVDELDGAGRLDRREFIGLLGATLAACGGNTGPVDVRQGSGRPPSAPTIAADPFQLGVASGDPLSDGAILWTRLAPRPHQGGGMPDERVPVVWEVSPRPEFGTLVGSGWTYARPELGHSVHVDVRGLQPDTWYWYRFRIGDQWVSPAGRTRTLPRAGSSPDLLRIGTASCQNYAHGYYPAHAHLAEENLDLVFFLGDYIYESGWNQGIREHPSGRPVTLDDFRNRYGLYKSDPNLRAAHAQCPWIATWDDHEVSNNYANLEPEHPDSYDRPFEEVRAAAYQAYYEHLPLRVPFPDDPNDLQIFRRFQWGDLVDVHVLDGRQYRSDQACMGEVGPPCDAVDDPDRTMLGDRQIAWLKEGLSDSTARWQAIAQQTVFSPITFGNAVINPDQWDGYAAERQELLESFGQATDGNLTVLTGDIHSGGFTTLHRNDDDSSSPRVGWEIVTTSISSSGAERLQKARDILVRTLDHIEYFNPGERGYTVVEYRPDGCTARYRTVETVKRRESAISTRAVFEMDAGGGHRRLG